MQLHFPLLAFLWRCRHLPGCQNRRLFPRACQKPPASFSLLGAVVPLEVRSVANRDAGTVPSPPFVLPDLQFGISSAQLRRSQSAAPRSPKAGVPWQDVSSARPAPAGSTRSEVAAQQWRAAEFSPFFPFLSDLSLPEFSQPLSQMRHSLNLFLEAQVPPIQLYKCVLWIVPPHEHWQDAKTKLHLRA